MATGKPQIQQLARQLFQLSLVDGRLSEEQVAGVLAYVEKHEPVNALAIVKEYRRLVAAEVAREVAIVEHAGPVEEASLSAIAGALSQRYKRHVTATARPNPGLLAGLRVRIGDDVFESSVSGQLAALATQV